MAHATYHLAAARLDDAGGVALHRMAEGEIRGQEEQLSPPCDTIVLAALATA